ncbi:NAD(P)/FAD-dependent oxidoreductase [Hymenobacter aerilatus]|uniref:NAD(P)/FAD-dependent oxidoreductase n=1 Tax=Hymenobacter aerilatus TaxID=2932251 RepID=A0A8T9SV37_9BACT|nr:NAD(P)/FAD-dependent oxidoreductase [Hymenobacter aerilatus]UOR04583.1 NAD(P)/FAD-dependent oxidoreductase [Hymenobacter aerilatus]
MKPTIATVRPARQLLTSTDYDVVIVGAGSAGLSAALILGRSMRRVLVCDAGAPRNVTSPAVQGFFTRDCTAPTELLRIGRSQLTPYDSVEVRELRVTAIKKEDGHFRVEANTEANRTTVATARKVILATGVEDELPPLDGMREFWGRGVLHCPYCHGWEVRNQPLAIYGRGKTVTGLALLVSRWSSHITVCTDGPGHLTENARRRLRQQGIDVREECVRQLVGRPDGMLRCVEFETGEPLECHALFLHAPQHQRAPFAEQLGCRFTKKGAVWVDKKQQTSVAGLYATGDLTPGQQQAIMAAAEGSKAGIVINEQLTREECPK